MSRVPLDLRLLAHQGGWDEILFVLAPLLVFAGLLALARRRADQLGGPRSDEAPVEPPIGGSGQA